MTDHNRHPDEERIAQWVGELPEAPADPAFRERLRREFATGTIEPVLAEEAPRREARPSRVPWWRVLVPVTAAAAVLIAVVGLNPGPPLRVVEVSGPGPVRIEGRTIPVAELASSVRAIHPPVEIEVAPGTTVDLLAEGVALYEVAGAHMTLPRSPGRWFAQAPACSLFAGEVRLKTGPEFAGSSLRVYTPEGMVEVTGTLLSVQCDEGGTCVCVLEGTAHVGVNEADLEPVTPGYRKIMLRDGTIDIIPVKPMHREGVIDFDRRVGDRIAE